MREYWRKPETTAKALRGDWYHTGDMGYLDETGHLYLVDRKKDMIISGAENIYSVEVENVISTHPVSDEVWGEQACGYRPTGGSAGRVFEDIIEFCRGRIGGIKFPSLPFDDGPLPTTGPGKIAKRRLRDRSGKERTGGFAPKRDGIQSRYAG